MNHLKRAAVLILCLVTLCSFSFAEDTFVLPTEEPADSGFELPEIASAGKYGALPDPANYMKPGKETPIHQSEEYQTNGKTYNIWVYPDATFATYHFEHYKDDCEKAGYTVSRETISGQSAYVIRGEQEAYVFPDYNDTVMVMIEQGMEVDASMPADEWAYVTFDDESFSNRKTIRFNTHAEWNDDQSTTLTGEKEYTVRISSNDDVREIYFSIPGIAKTGNEYYAFKPTYSAYGVTQKGIDPGINLILTRYGELPELYVYEIVPDTSTGLTSSSDYLMLNIFKVERITTGKRIRGELFGMFKNHTEVIIIDFSVIVPG